MCICESVSEIVGLESGVNVPEIVQRTRPRGCGEILDE